MHHGGLIARAISLLSFLTWKLALCSSWVWIAKQSVDVYIECKVAKNLVQSALGKIQKIIKLKITLYVLKSNNFFII